jgi:peptide/nickel transport system substrate-binding protein
MRTNISLNKWAVPLLVVLSMALAAIPVAGVEYDGVMTVGELFDIKSIDPIQSGSILTEKALVTESLVGVNSDMSLKPELAESWTQIDDKTWEIKLRKNVVFHDGSKMTANEVKFSLERAAQLDSKAASLMDLESVEVIDDLTIRIHTKELNPILPATLHYSTIVIISPNSLDSKGELQSPIGTGPFMLESFDPQTHTMNVVRNDKWWGGEVKLSKVIIRPILDPNTRALALENGEVDFTVDVPYSEADRIGAMDGIKVEKFQNPRIYVMDFNMQKAPLDDVRVRKAIAYGIDTKSIVSYVLFNIGRPAVGPFMPEFVWTNKNLAAYEQNVEKAKELLTEAGWTDSNGDGLVDKDGKALEINLLTYPNRPGLPPMAEAISGQLKEIGIKMNVEVTESGVIDEKRKTGDWNIYLQAMSTAMVPDPTYYLRMTYKTEGAYNYAGYSNALVDDLLVKASGTTNEQERLEMMNEVQSITQDEIPVLTVAYYGVIVASKDYVKGYLYDPTAHDYKLSPEMYIEK